MSKALFDIAIVGSDIDTCDIVCDLGGRGLKSSRDQVAADCQAAAIQADKQATQLTIKEERYERCSNYV
jgi:hypothetical protein